MSDVFSGTLENLCAGTFLTFEVFSGTREFLFTGMCGDLLLAQSTPPCVRIGAKRSRISDRKTPAFIAAEAAALVEVKIPAFPENLLSG